MKASRVIIRPIKDVIDESIARKRADVYIHELLNKATYIGDNLFLIQAPKRRISPSILAVDCIVKALIRLRMGFITSLGGIEALARGLAIHELYQEWFRLANPRIHVEVESEFEGVDYNGRMDIIYMRESDGEEIWGLIELKSIWRLTERRLAQYLRQIALYAHLLENHGITIREVYLVTMRDIIPIPLREVRRVLKEVMEELRILEREDWWPSMPPNPSLCRKCELKPICITYSAYSNLVDYGPSNPQTGHL